jgi:hypothetical protein
MPSSALSAVDVDVSEEAPGAIRRRSAPRADKQSLDVAPAHVVNGADRAALSSES